MLIAVLFMLSALNESRGETPDMQTRSFQFSHNGLTLDGLLDMPADGDASAIIVLVPGSGRSNVHTRTWNLALRQSLTGLGIGVYAYDKPGVGNSEGTFNSSQSVADSAEEVVAAVSALKDANLPGSDRIGFWGLSRAGWIIPLAMAGSPSENSFWISVSGATHLDNLAYLMAENWRILGYDQDKIDALVAEFIEGFTIQRTGGSYEEYYAAASNLITDPFHIRVRGDYTRERFENYQRFLLDNPPVIDAETGLLVHVPDFEETLNAIDAPVLALFGERDSQVDWRATRALYEKTLGRGGDLSITTFPQCNHFMRTCQTCGFGRIPDIEIEAGFGKVCPGYFDAIESWLIEKGFSRRAK